MAVEKRATFDAACQLLLELARAHCLGSVEVEVRADGRVELRSVDPRGMHPAWETGDLNSEARTDGALSPADALESMGRELARRSK